MLLANSASTKVYMTIFNHEKWERGENVDNCN